MKKSISLSVALAAVITLTSQANALELLVVKNYQQAELPELWKNAKTDQVPQALLGTENISSPSSAYASVFPKAFMQEELFVVCNKSCDEKELYNIRHGEIDVRDRSRNDVIEQSNVYFWLKKYFAFLDKNLNFKVDKYLKVTTNRQLRDETKGKKLKNNAFFNPLDVSLSFLPATNNLLFKLMGGKLNRSGFDPSVVVHEASHYLFHHLFPNAINDEIGGLNEGFADYMANIFLNTPKLGLVMMHGKTLRDSSVHVDKDGKFKAYEPNMEVHDLGERISLALWKTREMAFDKNEFDRLVIDAVIDLSQNSYASVHDFKVKMLERIPNVVSEVDLIRVRTTWETIFSGSPAQIHSLSFLDKKNSTTEALGFRTKQILPENLAKEYGTDAVTETNFTILQMETIVKDEQMAILMSSEKLDSPYWVALDLVKGNTLGIFDLNKNLITDSEELEKIKFLAEQAKGAGSTINDFKSKVKSFTELSQGKGDFSVAYKVKNKTINNETIIFNGSPIAGQKVRFELKRKLLTGVLFGMPEITSIELYLAPIGPMAILPKLENQTVIGYKLLLKTGTAMEVILNRTSR